MPAATRLATANIPKRYQHCTLGNFAAYNETAAEGRRARRDASPMPFPVVSRGLLLEGQPGVGKTHLAVAVLKHGDRDAPALTDLFYDTRDLLRVIRSTYDPCDPHHGARRSCGPSCAPTSSSSTTWARRRPPSGSKETMNLIVNTRYNERRMTLFTSNYLDIPEDDDPNSLLFRIGHRMRSRLHEMCEFLVLDGADYRELPTNGGVDDLVTMWKMRRKTLPSPRTRRQARAQLREPAARDGRADLKWPGGRAGS